MTLRRIVLRDFVIVRELELEFQCGFSVLTGETGAGKSIMIDALQFAFGSRAESIVIAQGAEKADVSAEFDAAPELASWMDDAGFERAESLLLRRTVDAQGRSRAWINGSPATATQLRDIADRMVDIHGQHAWQSLTRTDSVRALLDGYAGISTATLTSRWDVWSAAQKALAGAQAARDSLQRDQERLVWQIGELDKLAPAEGEWQELNAEHSRLANAQALLDAAQVALDELQADRTGASAVLVRALTSLQAQERLEPDFSAFAEILVSSLAQTEDCARSLQAYLRKTEPDPQRLAELDGRVTLWMSLARRYKRLPEDLHALLASWKAELQRLDAAADLEALERVAQEAQADYLKQARAVSRMRAKAAPKLAHAITQAMQGLGMQGGSFSVMLEPREPAQHGVEDATFMVAGHAGVALRPVGKVASGGELSRIALAIAVTTSLLGKAQTLIFDEVDAGIGGSVAETVGRLMKQLGRDRQVLAVTHLPQVAACADRHLLVAKRSDGKSTTSTVQGIEGEQRVAEIARMLGGERLSGTTLAHAKEMLGQGVPGMERER